MFLVKERVVAMTDDADWLYPWYEVEDTEVRRILEAQLALEIGECHVLQRRQARLIARRDGTDDALFALDAGQVAEVHLTWRRSKEEDPRWPATALFSSFTEWRAQRMRPLYLEFSQLD